MIKLFSAALLGLALVAAPAFAESMARRPDAPPQNLINPFAQERKEAAQDHRQMMREKMKNMSPEERAAMKAEMKERRKAMHEKMKNMTPEERQAMRKQRRDDHKEHRAERREDRREERADRKEERMEHRKERREERAMMRNQLPRTAGQSMDRPQPNRE